MRPVVWMIAGAVLSWLALSFLMGGSAPVDVGLGMAGPLVAAVGTWILVIRNAGREIERLTGRMLAAFGAKIVFFGAFVVLAVRGVGVRPVAFAMSFAGYFIAFLVVEAVLFRRVLADHAHA